MKRDKITVNVTPKMKYKIDGYVKSDNYKSQSEFCNNALEFYISYLENNDNDYLGKVITQTVNAVAEYHTDRISNMLFKMAVSIEKQSLLNAYPDDDEDYLEEIAIENVQKRYGKL
ncbi:MAG: hypothetical protein IJQ50_05670 [Clostridia bacterium]|nr:hypothetical protein [Clostridia bacterium]